MESSGLMGQKFIKIVSRMHLGSDEMDIPLDFCSKYGHRMSSRLFLKFRNGYELPVSFDRELGKLSGLNGLYNDFQMRGGEMLVFEYFGRSDFNVYIIGIDSSEIHYPNIVHQSQSCRPRIVSLRNGGIKFVKYVIDMDMTLDEFELPTTFLDRCSSSLISFVQMVISNGKNFDVWYNVDTQKLGGMQKLCEIFGNHSVNNFHMLLFSFDGVSLFIVSTFSDNLLEIVCPGTPLSMGLDGNIPEAGLKFEIEVQRFHMNKYCHGVDIYLEYESVSDLWAKTDYIHVYSGGNRWRLQIRHRNNWKRITVHDGWLQFRDDLCLQTGDICVFEAPFCSYHHFQVRVVKNQA